MGDFFVKPKSQTTKRLKQSKPAVIVNCYEPLSAATTRVLEFVRRSVSENTRKTYGRIVREFLNSFGNPDPTTVTPLMVIDWRDELIRRRQQPHTITLKLAVVRAFFRFLVAGGYMATNPATIELVPPPSLPEDLKGRTITPKEVGRLLAAPDRERVEGARDYVILLMLLRLSLRVSELCSLRSSSLRFTRGQWILHVIVKGGRERRLPMPDDIHIALKRYLQLDRDRRETLKCDGPNAFFFQPLVNYRTLVHDKPLSPEMVRIIVKRWGEYSGVGKLSPHDLRRTAITRALDLGLTYRQVQMMSGHKDPKTVMRYDHGRENLDQNAVKFLRYEE
jgi:integrase/recombinase XerD